MTDGATIGVVGCGTMGSGIAEACARAGYTVRFVETDEALVATGTARIERSVSRAVDRGKLTQEQAKATLTRISGSSSFDSLARCAIVVEAVPERMEMKQEVFRELDRVLDPGAILATNTSSLAVIDLAVATGRPSRVLGLHFFNPAPVMELVEIVRTLVSDADAVATAQEFATSLGKKTVVCLDRAGFVANKLLFPYLNNAVRMLESGFASREDIDAAMMLGCGHPMGPLALLDLIGLDSAHEILEALYEQFHHPHFTPAPLTRQLVTAGFLGRKTGRGFYEYEHENSPRMKETGRHRGPVREAAAAHVKRIGVLGTGIMATGIAEVAARAGFRVHFKGRSKERVLEAIATVEKSLAKAMQRGKLGADEVEEARSLIDGSDEAEILSDCDLIIEAIIEDADVKVEHFRQLDKLAPVHTIFATTTSSLPIITLAAATQRPEQVVGMHFFNPASVMRLVEIGRTVRTSDETVDTAVALGVLMGKHCVVCPDRAGFIVNSLLFPYLNDAVKMLEAGYATAEDIDTAMKLGCGHPLGPFALMDIIGLDVTLRIIESLYAEFRWPAYAPAHLLEHLVQAGYLGRKAGRGFFTY